MSSSCAVGKEYNLGDPGVAELLVGSNVSLLYKTRSYTADVVGVQRVSNGIRLIIGVCFEINIRDVGNNHRRLPAAEMQALFSAPIRGEASVKLFTCGSKHNKGTKRIVVQTPWAEAYATFTFTKGDCSACGKRLVGSAHDPI